MCGLIFSLLILLVIFWIYAKYRYSYWQRKGIPQLSPMLPFGNGKKLYMGQISASSAFLQFYSEFKEMKADYGGIYFVFEPFLIALNNKLIKSILIKDYDHWTSHGVFHHKEDFLTENVFSTYGPTWKSIRKGLTPAFTNNKLKGLFEVIQNKTCQLEDIIEKHVLNKEPVDMKKLCHCFATDVTSSCGFGIDYNSLENQTNPLRYYLQELYNVGKLRPVLEMIVPWHILGKFSHKSRLGKDLEDFSRDFLQSALQNFQADNSSKSYYLKLLKELRSANIITENRMVSETLCYLVASVDTTSVTISNCLWELAKNQEVQEKLGEEILTVTNNYDGKITFEGLLEMNYLDKILKETLRLHSVFPVIFRKCTKDYQIPDTKIVLKKGTRAAIPIIGLHMDPEFYPNPVEFNPENFSEENIQNRPSMTWLGFGEGPRMCLGSRLALLETKTAISSLVKKFKFICNQKSEIVLATRRMINQIEGNLWLDVEIKE